MRIAAFVLAAALLGGCWLAPRKVSLADPEVQELLAAARAFPREAHGFSPLPSDPNVDIRLEKTAGGAYDRMLHIYEGTSRTIAFRQTPGGLRWIHEQESFPGPNFYDSPDGRLREQICLTVETEAVSTSAPPSSRVEYFGNDARIGARHPLKLADVAPVLIEWGYRPKR